MLNLTIPIATTYSSLRLTYDERLVISELLGYEICFVKKEKQK